MAVSPTDTSPNYHITLTDPNGVEINFVCCDEKGDKADWGITRNPLDRSAIKTSSGRGKYDDQVGPYEDIEQSDWSCGRAWEDFDTDNSRYFDGQAVDTWHEGVLLGGLPTYCTGYRSSNQSMPGSVTWVTLGTTAKYQSMIFTTPTPGYTPKYIEVLVRRRGTPTGTLTAAIYTNSSGSPGTLVSNCSGTATTTNITDTVSEWYRFSITGSALTAATPYHVVVYDTGTATSTNYWQLGCNTDSATSAKKSSDGITWAAASYAPYFRVTDVDNDMVARFAEYKGQLYFATQYDSGTTTDNKLYMNGFRGVADSNAGALSTTVDASQSWTVDALIGSIIEIYDGQGVEEETQRWRTITDNDATTVTVSPVWNVTQLGTTADATVYNILGTNTFVSRLTNYYPAHDLAIMKDVLWMALGGSNMNIVNKSLRKFREYFTLDPTTTVATWTTSSATTSGFYADFLETIADPNEYEILWLGSNNSGIQNTIVYKRTWDWDYEDQFIGLKMYPTETFFMLESDPITHVTVTPGNLPVRACSIVVASSFTTGLICTDKITSTDFSDIKTIQMSITVNQDLVAGDLQLVFDDTAKCASTIKTVNFPAMTAFEKYDNYSRMNLDMDFDVIGVAGATAVISVGLNLATNLSTELRISFYIKGLLVTSSSVIPIGKGQQKITNIIGYEDPKTLYVLKEGSLHKVENNVSYQLPLDELGAIKSQNNGAAVCVGDVYLWFSTGGNGGIQRFFNQSMTSVGLNLDSGLPANRQGPVSCLVSYPGAQVFASVDAGTSGISGVYTYHGSGWHEVYRAPRAGARIRSIYIQALPDGKRRLWISQGSDVLWIPISDNPYYDNTATTTNYNFIWESVLESGWHYAGMVDIKKQYKALSIFAESLTAGAQTIEMDYKVDGDTSWTPVTGVFDTVPSEEVPFSTSTPPSVSAKKLKYRLRIQTNNSSKTPKIIATVLKCFSVIPPKYSYSWITKLTEGDLSLNYQGDDVLTFGTYATVQAGLTALQSLVDNATALKMNSAYSILDNKTVQIYPFALRPLRMLPDDQVEEHIVAITVVET